MLSGQLTVSNTLGLHARAAAQLVKLASRFSSKITLARPDLNIFADAKSILSLLTLAAAKGTILEIAVEGDDEADAFGAIQLLFRSDFAHDQIQPTDEIA